jgi:hypothetical protein
MHSDGRGKFTGAVEDAMAEQVLDAVNPIRDGAVADVEHSCCGGGVQTGLQIAPERVAQHAGPRVLRGQRPQLVPDEPARGTDVAQQRRLKCLPVSQGVPLAGGHNAREPGRQPAHAVSPDRADRNGVTAPAVGTPGGTPGVDSNTNYLLLCQLLEQLTGTTAPVAAPSGVMTDPSGALERYR